MRLFELISAQPLVWSLFLVYVAGTSWLAWLGHRKTDDIVSYSVGKGDMSPFVVGVTLAASIASTATFVINPGFVYVHGLSALMHLGVAAGLGITLGLIVMSVGFRRIGAKHAAITLPQWIGKRYGSTAMAVFFAAINLLSLTFVVLIVGGISIVMQQVMGLTNLEALTITIVFVFSYIFVGGTYAHAIPRGDEIRTWEHELYEAWLPDSGFEAVKLAGYGYQLQVYEEGRFQGPGEQIAESEIDVFVPIVPTESA